MPEQRRHSPAGAEHEDRRSQSAGSQDLAGLGDRGPRLQHQMEPHSDLSRPVPGPDWRPPPMPGGFRGRLRAVWRVIAISTLTGGFFAYYLLARVFCPAAERKSQRNRYIQIWARTATRLMGIRIRSQGTPPEGCLVVSNHLSYADILVLAALFPSIFVSKAEVAGWPLMGPVARTMGTIFVERENKRGLPQVAHWIGRELAAGGNVVLFPEGTSSSGAGLLPFRPSLLAPAVAAGRPVAYASIAYRSPEGYPPASDVICWWGGMTFGGHILALLRLPSFEALVHFGPDTLEGTDRKVLADRLWHAVHKIFTPTA
jgi:1-acyl-sn-glycerol-3-phosphate acyltransferase